MQPNCTKELTSFRPDAVRKALGPPTRIFAATGTSTIRGYIESVHSSQQATPINTMPFNLGPTELLFVAGIAVVMIGVPIFVLVNILRQSGRRKDSDDRDS